MGEQDFSQLEVLEKSSEHKATFFQVGQTLEGQWNHPLDWQMDKSEETARDEVTCSEETCKSQQHCSGFSPCRLCNFSLKQCMPTG